MLKTVACPEVIPGRKPRTEPANEPVTMDFRDSFLLITGSLIFCSGISGVFVNENNRVDIPNNPVNAGNNADDGK
jgi:hypothetical protein